MNKIIAISFVTCAFVLTAGSASAASTTTPIVVGNGDPFAVTQSWGLTGHQSVVVPAGTTIVDEGGFTTRCELWEKRGCVDISKTQSYRMGMIEIARTLIATGQTNRFPAFAGWIRIAR